MIRDEETMTLDQIIQRYAEAESNALDRKLIEHLGKAFFLDQHFIKWFKSHYDFYIAIDRTIPITDYNNPNYISANLIYRFQGPDWIPFSQRLKRKIRKFLRS